MYNYSIIFSYHRQSKINYNEHILHKILNSFQDNVYYKLNYPLHSDYVHHHKNILLFQDSVNRIYSHETDLDNKSYVNTQYYDNAWICLYDSSQLE